MATPSSRAMLYHSNESDRHELELADLGVYPLGLPVNYPIPNQQTKREPSIYAPVDPWMLEAMQRTESIPRAIPKLHKPAKPLNKDHEGRIKRSGVLKWGRVRANAKYGYERFSDQIELWDYLVKKMGQAANRLPADHYLREFGVTLDAGKVMETYLSVLAVDNPSRHIREAIQAARNRINRYRREYEQTMGTAT